ARTVITYAYAEAKLLQHNYVGTEHLLLGMLREGTGIGALVLADMGVDVDVVRSEIEHRIGRGTQDVPDRSPFTPRSKRVLELALNEAIQLGHNYIGTEHQLLGLLRVDDGVAAQILNDVYGIEIASVRHDIIRRLMAIGSVPKPSRRRSKPFMRPPVTWASPVDPALLARRTRLLGDIEALLDENGRLREENTNLRALLHEHGIDLGEPGEAGAEPA
ncbi:MAG: ATP-dependent Clp protease ATP-binding subunit ClpC, partial [Acidimicrobiaceae bacterium]